jgi:hypothetical protein
MEKILDHFKPELIIELGTFLYGLTLFLHERCPKATLISYDKFYPLALHPLRLANKSGRRIKHEDILAALRCFNYQYVSFVISNILKKPDRVLQNTLAMPERKLLYCDNGKKTREMAYYGTCLNRGDIMGVHDWGTEVNPDHPSVKEVMKLFVQHPLNREFKEKKLLSRFFIKVR